MKTSPHPHPLPKRSRKGEKWFLKVLRKSKLQNGELLFNIFSRKT